MIDLMSGCIIHDTKREECCNIFPFLDQDSLSSSRNNLNPISLSEYLDPTKLLNIIDKLRKKIPIFPVDCCEIAANIVEKEFPKLKYVNGIFMKDDGCGIGHAWNYLEEIGVYLDLTVNQFIPYGEPYLLLHIDSPVVKKHYIEGYYAAW